jgi:hypothetical protein
VAALVAALATALADLHELGIVHGHVDASHVLVGVAGRPVLCGFGDGDPPARPHDDVAALGALLVELLGSDEVGEPIPDRRWWRARPWAGWERRALLLLADQASAEPPTRRPTARRLAAAIADAVPSPGGEPPRARHVRAEPAEDDDLARLRATAVADPPAPRTRRGLAVTAVGLVLTALAGRIALADDPPNGTAPPPLATVAPAEIHTATPVRGSVLEAGGRQYRVGQPGDAVLVEDWDCDGEATPALLRPATGEVFVFPRWIDDGTLAVRPAVQLDDARALLSEVGDGACPTLAVRTASGDLVPVHGTDG